MRKKSGVCLQASYTIEAAILVPLFLSVLLGAMMIALDCNRDVAEASAAHEQLEKIEPTTWIWRSQLLDSVGEIADSK